MKTIEVISIVVILTILTGLTFLLCGCTPVEPTLRSQTMALNTTVAGYQWSAAFGDSVESAQGFNIRLLNQEFDKLKKRIEVLEKK